MVNNPGLHDSFHPVFDGEGKLVKNDLTSYPVKVLRNIPAGKEIVRVDADTIHEEIQTALNNARISREQLLREGKLILSDEMGEDETQKRWCELRELFINLAKPIIGSQRENCYFLNPDFTLQVQVVDLGNNTASIRLIEWPKGFEPKKKERNVKELKQDENMPCMKRLYEVVVGKAINRKDGTNNYGISRAGQVDIRETMASKNGVVYFESSAVDAHNRDMQTGNFTLAQKQTFIETFGKLPFYE
ncbi:MAG TPA: hypothetical protein VD999_04655 [Vitreimonas sp.]|nr:hypothetical protein [Vitreimonas sp.]